MGQRAVFLDRDGVLIEDVHFVDRPERVVPIPGTAEATRRLQAAGFLVVVVTNQSGIGRGLFDEAAFVAVNAAIRGHGVVWDAIYHCPHTPEAGCACRKPLPGMLLAAARDLGIDLVRSVTVGDSARDIEAGRAAGTRTVLVRTGKGREVPAGLADHATADLAAAVAWILVG